MQIDGDARGMKFAFSPVRPPGEGSGISYVYDGIEYDPGRNSTTVTESLEAQFTQTSNTFPSDSYSFELLLSLNATYSGFEGIASPMTSPSPNYNAEIAVTSPYSNVLTNATAHQVNMPNYGSIYAVSIYLTHTSDFQNYATFSFVWLPIAFWILLLVMLAVFFLDTFARLQSAAQILDDSSYFAIVASVIVFLPIYLPREIYRPLLNQHP